jgi:hypothetical protein
MYLCKFIPVTKQDDGFELFKKNTVYSAHCFLNWSRAKDIPKTRAQRTNRQAGWRVASMQTFCLH